MIKPAIIESGEFEGWMTWPSEPFEHDLMGPLHFRIDDKGPVCAFRAEHRHMNSGGVMHGGCLMSFADFSLFGIAHEHMKDDAYGLTVAFSSEFLDGPRVGEYVEARGEVLRAGGSLIFVRGLITSDGRPCLNFSGTIKRGRKK
ncbi:MAG: PaaI family thioesterase [Aquisalinus sp.]|nr:PaaI family thioesterase [Aquisalinus sp.]